MLVVWRVVVGKLIIVFFASNFTNFNEFYGWVMGEGVFMLVVWRVVVGKLIIAFFASNFTNWANS